jgi:hypothetical protein
MGPRRPRPSRPEWTISHKCDQAVAPEDECAAHGDGPPGQGQRRIVAFALGIGVSTAVFSVFSGVLLRPLPYPKPDQLVRVYDTQPACAKPGDLSVYAGTLAVVLVAAMLASFLPALSASRVDPMVVLRDS